MFPATISPRLFFPSGLNSAASKPSQQRQRIAFQVSPGDDATTFHCFLLFRHIWDEKKANRLLIRGVMIFIPLARDKLALVSWICFSQSARFDSTRCPLLCLVSVTSWRFHGLRSRHLQPVINVTMIVVSN